MNPRLKPIVVAMTACVVIFACATGDTVARGLGGGGMARSAGGGMARGAGISAAGASGFSRNGPAASGGFALRAGATPAQFAEQGLAEMAASQAGATRRADQMQATARSQNRANMGTTGQAERTERQGQRQDGMTERTDIRQSGSTERQANRQNAANTYYNNGGSSSYHHEHWDNDQWDDGEVAAVAIGAAAVGAMAGYAAGGASSNNAQAPSTTVVYAAPPPDGEGGLPCTPNTAVVNGVTYYQCGTSWYTQAYGSNGVIYTPVPSP